MIKLKVENTLVFHIGSPKTGSTAIQYFLRNNQEFLKEQGWYYPFICENENVDHTNEYLLRLLRCFAKVEGDEEEKKVWNAQWKILRDLLTRNNVVISDERAFYTTWLTDFLRAAVKEYANIKVVVYLRRQDLYLESWWNQDVKYFHVPEEFFGPESVCRKPFATLEETLTDDTIWQLGDYLSKLRQITEIVGEENLIVRAYEKGQLLQEDVVADFLSVLGMNFEEADLEKTKEVNNRLDGLYTEIARIYEEVLWGNHATLSEDPSLRKLAMWVTCVANDPVHCGCEGQSGRVGYLPVFQRREILERFREDNAEIAQRYMHRDDGKLFYDENVDIPQYMPLESDFEHGMMRVFWEFALRTKIRLSALQKQNQIFFNMGRKTRVVCYGTADECRDLIVDAKIKIDCIIGYDFKKQRTDQISGLPIISEAALQKWDDCYILIVMPDAEGAAIVEGKLQARGLHKYEDYVWTQEIGLPERF